MTLIEKDLLSTRPSCYVFDIDNTLAEVDHIVLTKKEGYEKRLEKYSQEYLEYSKAKKIYENDMLNYEQRLIFTPPVEPIEPVRPQEPDSSQLDKWDEDYFYKYLGESIARTGLLDVFIALAQTKRVILLTARKESSRPDTIEWLNKAIIDRAGKDIFRRINYQLICKPEPKSKKHSKDEGESVEPKKAETVIEYKIARIKEIIKQYNVQLIFEDDAEITEAFTQLGLLVFSPNKRSKNIPS